MEFEFSARHLLVAGVFWLIVLAGVWKFAIGDGYSLFNKIAISIFSLPIFYFIVGWQANR